MDLLLVIDGDKTHYVYINGLNRFMFHKTKNKNNKYFCKSYLQCFSSKNVLKEHKEGCLSINGAQSVRLEKRTIEFNNYFKQILVPFKICADFECNLKSVESYEVFYSKKYQDQVSCSLVTNLFVLMMSLPNRLLFLQVKILLINLLKQFLKSMSTTKK